MDKLKKNIGGLITFVGSLIIVATPLALMGVMVQSLMGVMVQSSNMLKPISKEEIIFFFLFFSFLGVMLVDTGKKIKGGED